MRHRKPSERGPRRGIHAKRLRHERQRNFERRKWIKWYFVKRRIIGWREFIKRQWIVQRRVVKR